MHIAAQAPEYLRLEDIPEDAKSKARDLFMQEAEEEGGNKPKDIKEKIVEGKLGSYLKEKVLLDQPFIKNQDITIKGLLDEATQKFGERTEIGKFVRFAI
jgi:elongation factor Ts